MIRFRKTICLAMTLCLLLGCGALSANASDDPLAVKNFEEFGAAAPVEEPLVEEPSVEEAPAEEGPAPEAPAEEAPAEEAPVEEVPAEDPPAEEAPNGETPAAEETPDEESAVEAPAEEEAVPEESAVEASAETETAEQETEAAEEAEDVDTETPEEQEVRTYETVPLYFQTDYPNVRFGSGTLASNGCSITSLAMVASYMTGHEYLPDELARYFGGRAENNIARLEMGSDALQLPYYKAKDWNETMAAIEDGKIAIVLVGTPSPFTQSQHFVVVTGMTETGKLLIQDSYKPNYEKWDLKDGFANGFAKDVLLQGYSGAWIYDVEAMPEEPYIYYEPAPDHSYTRYPEVELTLEQEDLLAKVVWVESRGECDAGQQAVAEVVLNRLVSDRFPNNLNDVIYGEGQFRSAPFLKDATPSQTQYEAIEKALYGPNILPKDVFYFATKATTEKVWGGIGGHIFCYAEN